MENFKLLPDSQIMIKLLDRLRYSANALSKKLHVTPSAIYHIMNGQNAISDDMAYKIIDVFPEVNYMFLKKGEEPIITNKVYEKQQQTPGIEDFASFANVPKILKNIESVLENSQVETLLKRLLEIEEKREFAILKLETFNSEWSNYCEGEGMQINNEGVLNYLDTEFKKEVETNKKFKFSEVRMKLGRALIASNSAKSNEWENVINSIMRVR